MLKYPSIFVAVLLAGCSASSTKSIPELKPYPLPAAVQQSIEELAGKSDVLVIAEVPGTQEMPRLEATLLEPLSKLGYGVLALEVLSDEQAALLDWAAGKTNDVPLLFTTQSADGRGSVQLLSLIRMALSPPYGWKLICFDETQEEWANSSQLKRNAHMAEHFTELYEKCGTHAKVLAICGGCHGMTANPPDNLMKELWPSFAANLQTGHPDWRIRSIEVSPHAGSCFNLGIKPMPPLPPIDAPEVHLLDNQPFNMHLDLPRVTPATLLIPQKPLDTAPHSAEKSAENGH